MSRRFKILVALCLVLAVLTGALLWALPEIVRRVAVGKLTVLSGRQTSIERVELNLFTGRFAVNRLRMARRPGHGPEAFVEFDRLAGRVALSALFGFDISLVELSLVRPAVRITRTGPVDFDFADLLQLFTAPVADDRPSRFTFSLGRLVVTEGAVVMDDAFLSPGVQWRLEALDVEASGITTKRDQPTGGLRMSARFGDARLEVTSRSVTLTPVSLSLDVVLADFDLARARPYLPPDLPAVPATGKLGLALKLERVRTGDALGESSVSGEVKLEALSVVQRDRPVPFLTADRLTVAIERMDFLARDVLLGAVEIEGLGLRAARDKQGDIDLLAALRRPETAHGAAATDKPADPASPPAGVGAAPPASPRGPPAGPALGRVRVARLALKSGTVTFGDEGVAPGREWKLEGVTVDGAGFSTSPDDPAGKLEVRAQVTARPGPARPATLAIDADSVRLAPLAASARVRVDGFALATVRSYWPESVPAVVPEGAVALALDVGVARDGNGQLTRAVASGSVRVDALQVVRRGQPGPFLRIPTLTVGLTQADAVAQTLALGAVEVGGADLRVVRDAEGRIDLLGLTPAAEPAIEVVKARTGLNAVAGPPKSSPAPPPAAAQWKLSLDRFTFAKGTLTFEDRAISPATTLTLGDVTLEAQRVAWPFTKPATFSLAVAMPGGGRTDGKGTAMLEPLNVQVTLSTRETPIEPYQAYFPFAARLAGLFSGDSLSEIQRGPKGELILASRGTAWASNLAVRAPGAPDDVARMDAMVIRDIDFSWPNYALVDRVVLTHPQIRVERDAEGAINLRALFAPRPGTAKDGDAEGPAAEAPASKSPDTGPSLTVEDGGEKAPGGGPAQTMVIDFNEIDIENGFARFIDHTTRPPFSEDMSRLSVTIKSLSNVMGRAERTTLTLQALVGSDGALDMRGDLSGLGESLRADLVAELRDFSLSTANPYADTLTSWTVQRGKLQAKIHYRIEGDRITAQHDLAFNKLAVQKSTASSSDEAKRKIGVPLGLAVALLKDSNDNIDFSLPLSGTLSDQSFDWGEAIWTGVKQVLVKVLLSPFSAIGRLFKGSDDSVDKLEIDPVTFAPGSAVIAPSTEAQLIRLADFLRRSPNIKLTLEPVVTPADLASLREQEVAARVEAFRQTERLPDQAAALRAYYQQKLPEVTLPKAVGDQMALLAEREPVPEGRLAQLVERRIEATRDNLVKTQGILEARVVPPAPPAPPAPAEAGQGRVEFTIVPADG